MNKRFVRVCTVYTVGFQNEFQIEINFMRFFFHSPSFGYSNGALWNEFHRLLIVGYKEITSFEHLFVLISEEFQWDFLFFFFYNGDTGYEYVWKTIEWFNCTELNI